MATLVITLTSPSPLLPPPPYHTRGVLLSKAFIFQGNLCGHLTREKRSTIFVEKEDMGVPRVEYSP